MQIKSISRYSYCRGRSKGVRRSTPRIGLSLPAPAPLSPRDQQASEIALSCHLFWTSTARCSLSIPKAGPTRSEANASSMRLRVEHPFLKGRHHGRKVLSGAAHISPAGLHQRATEADHRLNRRYDDIKAGLLNATEAALSGRIAGLIAIWDQARTDAVWIEAMLQSSQHNALTGAAVCEPAAEARTRLRLGRAATSFVSHRLPTFG